MQIIRLAAGKQIKIRATIDHSTGKVDIRVVDNPDGTGCHGDANARMLHDLLEAEVPGFGEMEIEDSGLTEHGFAQKMKDKTNPLPTSPLTNPNAPQIQPGAPQPQVPQVPQEGELDTGYGV